jgi:hypothetical protein
MPVLILTGSCGIAGIKLRLLEVPGMLAIEAREALEKPTSCFFHHRGIPIIHIFVYKYKQFTPGHK